MSPDKLTELINYNVKLFIMENYYIHIIKC